MRSPESDRATMPNVTDEMLALAFAPLDKRALGLALGLATALAVALLTCASLVVDPEQRFPLGLLSNFLYGYRVSWVGAIVGAGWGFIAGFFWGWFLAFSRNLVLAIWLMLMRVRADLATSRDFLDHI